MEGCGETLERPETDAIGVLVCVAFVEGLGVDACVGSTVDSADILAFGVRPGVVDALDVAFAVTDGVTDGAGLHSVEHSFDMNPSGHSLQSEKPLLSCLLL